MLEELAARLAARDRRALARLITLAANGDRLSELRAIGAGDRHARVFAVTGPGGVGKSTLVGKLIEQFRRAGQSVAVLACDPESPLTGGALLGDRFRMPASADDAGVYIRSLAAPSGRQAVAEHLDVVITLCERFGFDTIIVETVGAGQGDTAVRDLVDGVVLLLQPETGDELQWEKAGVLEVADIIVIHKADMPGADRAAAQIRSSLDIGHEMTIPLILVSSRTGLGLPDLMTAINSMPKRDRERTWATRLLRRSAREELDRRVEELEIGDVVTEHLAGRLAETDAVVEILRRLSVLTAGVS